LNRSKKSEEDYQRKLKPIFFVTVSMDGIIGTTDAAAGLLALAQTPEREKKHAQRTPSKMRRDSHYIASETPEASPQRQFVLTGVKRTRDPNMLSVIYTSDGTTMTVPLMKDDSNNNFYARRRLAAGMLFDNSRADVFCSWNKTLLHMKVSDARWVKFRDTFREQRFMYKNLQLVILRLTCAKGEAVACTNCATPSRRMSCLTPALYHFVMPLPNCLRFSESVAETALDDFEPINVKKNTEQYSMRIPSIYVRSV
jgi:hypothetical protein